MEVSYCRPAGVENPAGTDLLVSAEGGAVVIDAPLLHLWRAADGRTLGELHALEVLAGIRDILPEALACLAEAGLLRREPTTRPEPVATRPDAPPASVAAIVVVSTVAELPWLTACLESLHAQTLRPAEIILIDNGSVISGAEPSGPVPVRVIRRRRRGTYAAALNEGVAAAAARFFLLLNADVQLHPDAVRLMVETAGGDPRIAAVAPKLKLWRTPGFLNGIGNRVQTMDWGTDNGIGQLDLGQFDHWTDVPSGCFVALLVSAAVVRDVGSFDAGYPAYYEDTDWAYRARALGYRIAAAPAAEVRHVFSVSWNAPDVSGLSPAKHARAAAGRLRFFWKLLQSRSRFRLVYELATGHLRDATRLCSSGDYRMSLAQVHGLALFLKGLPTGTWRRYSIQRRRRLSDVELFTGEEPPSCLEGSKPLLTSALIRNYYAPLIRSGRTRPLPETA